MLEKGAASKARSARLLDMKKNVASIETDKRHLVKFNAKLLPSAEWNGAMRTLTGVSFIEAIPTMYSRFAPHVEKAIGQYFWKAFRSFVLVLIHQEVDGGVVRTYKLWDFRGKMELFLQQITRYKCVPCTPSTCSLSQVQSKDCKRLWIMRWVRNNGWVWFQFRSRCLILCLSCSQTKLWNCA